jgi:hypothetical protein
MVRRSLLASKERLFGGRIPFVAIGAVREQIVRQWVVEQQDRGQGRPTDGQRINLEQLVLARRSVPASRSDWKITTGLPAEKDGARSSLAGPLEMFLIVPLAISIAKTS